MGEVQSSIVSAGISSTSCVATCSKAGKTTQNRRRCSTHVIWALHNVARFTGRQRYVFPSKLKRSPRSHKRMF